MKQKVLIEKETLLPFWLLGSAIITVIAHNLTYAFFPTIGAVFFIVAQLLILAFFAAVIYDIMLYLNKGIPADVWRLGWLGVFGMLSIFIPLMVFFYGFFGFFGLRKK